MCTAVLVGGIDMMSQAIMLAKKPHVIVGERVKPMDLKILSGI